MSNKSNQDGDSDHLIEPLSRRRFIQTGSALMAVLFWLLTPLLHPPLIPPLSK